jgi:hypothetical protein
MIRAKFECGEARRDDEYGNEHVRFFAVCGDDNKPWSTYTPSGTVEMTISNPGAQGRFKPGACYYLDFSEAPAEE